MAEIFISYSHEDRDKVLSIVAKIQERGIDVWIDQYKIPGGSNWGQEIIENVKSCKVVLLMASDHALNSDNVAREIAFASDKQKRIIPLIIQENLTETDKTSFWLATLQRIEAHAEFEAWSDALLTSLRASGVNVPENARARPAGEVAVMTCLMAHLADRAEQERQIFMAIETHLDRRPARPLVFMLHGEATQCIDEFVRRLHRYTLPRQLALLNLPDQLAWKFVPWPKPQPAGRRDAKTERTRAYQFDLHQRLGLRSSASIDSVHRQLINIRSSVGLWSLVPSELWQAEEPALIDEIMRFWSDLPNLPQPLFLFFVIAYRERKRSILARWMFGNPSPEIRKTVAALEQAGPYDLDIVVLPELADITQAECEDWIRDVLRPTDIERAMQQLEQSFRDERLAPQQGAPMERLVPMLNRLVPSGTTLRGI